MAAIGSRLVACRMPAQIASGMVAVGSGRAASVIGR